MITITDAPAAETRDHQPDLEQQYARVAATLGRYRDFCMALALVLFFGRSLWAWVSGRSWVVDPDVGALYIIGFPALFLVLGGRELPAWLRLWSARRLARRGSRQGARPWQYVAAGVVLGASAMLIGTAILSRL